MSKEEKQKKCKHKWNIAFQYGNELVCGNCGKIKYKKYKSSKDIKQLLK